MDSSRPTTLALLLVTPSKEGQICQVHSTPEIQWPGTSPHATAYAWEIQRWKMSKDEPTAAHLSLFGHERESG